MSEINRLSSRRLSPQGLEVLLAAKGELSHLLKVQEAYWAQRSRVLWLSAGDQNTSFFHAKASARKKKNAIVGLYDWNGYWQTSTTEVLRVASDYFESLFSANPQVDAPAFLEHISPSVTADMNSGLLASFTAEEVIAAFRDINPRKSPGIDGLPSGFFRQHWDILGEDFVSLCLDLLRGHTDMASVNETVIVLIPKVDKPTSMRQLCPISLCTVIYKTVSKVLVNRGDFSEILTLSEKQGGNRKPHHQLTDFRECLLRNNLADCKPSQGWFTWMKSGPRVAPTRERLDRFIADKDWFLRFPTFRAWSEYNPNSDHHFILLDTVAPSIAPEARGSFAARLSTICDGLRQWQSAKRVTDWERIPRLRSEINHLSSRRLSPKDLEVLLAAKGELRHLLKVQEAYWQTSTREVLRIASDYFVALFSANPPVEAPAFLEHIPPSVTEDMNSGPLAAFTAEEVIAAFRDINPRKSPGIDGLPSGFFRQHWDILGEDFVSLCLDLLRGHADMASVNEIVIVLIPKVDKPTSMR
ncbi:hypothetical protein GQ457_10G012900 [Hibiscus cannabinus]